MKQIEVKVLKNKKIHKKYFKLSFSSPFIAENAEPGQFLEVKIGGNAGPLLRKPFGVHRIKGATIEILYEIVGKGTQILSEKKSGDSLDIIGPLGNGFDYRGMGYGVRGTVKRPVLIAGGIGVAPLVFLAQKLLNRKPNTENLTPIVLIGAKTKKDILCEKEFKDLGCEVKIATDDGSKGHKGFITELLKRELSAISYQLSAIYACGPKPMLEETASIAGRNDIKCRVLLEEYMACGAGVCLGCAVKIRPKTKDRRPNFEYKMVCKDGPVFEGSEIIWQ